LQQCLKQGQKALLAAMGHFLAQRYADAETATKLALNMEAHPELTRKMANQTEKTSQA